MNYGNRFEISRRCDEPMKRSKEKCRRPSGKRWKCDGNCKQCICCLIMADDGTEHHFNPLRKGEVDEIQYP